MPPLVLEFGVAIALVTGVIRVTSVVNKLEQSSKIAAIESKVATSEILGKIDVIRTKIDRLEGDSVELKLEMKESRKYRFNDPHGNKQ